MKNSPALQFVSLAWDAMPHSSWQRLNAGMGSAINNAIGSGMRFDPGDFDYIYKNFRAHYWIGESIEGLYRAACGGKRGDYNLSAAIAIEKYLGREPWLWAEDCKTPKRLHVGERFRWKGLLVTVTSFNDEKKSLVACTYKENDDGDFRYVDGKHRRLISERAGKDKGLTQKWSAPCEADYERSKIDKRFTITHDELMAVRKAMDAKVRKYLKEIAEAKTGEILDEIEARVVKEGRTAFRHFDIEALREAYSTRRKAVAHELDEADALNRWMNGESIYRHFNTVRLRLKDDAVETSTGQHVTIKSARRALMFVNKYREVGWQPNGETHEVDNFPIKSISATEVVVGCTTIPMSEVDRIAPQLRKS